MFLSRMRAVAFMIAIVLFAQGTAISGSARIPAPTEANWTFTASTERDSRANQATLFQDVAIFTATSGEVIAIAVDGGKPAWRHELPGGSETPVTIVGNTVLVAGNNSFEALNALNGSMNWSFEGQYNEAVWTPPLVVGNTVIFGTTAESAIHALDIETGGEIWRSSSDGAAIGDLAYANGVIAYADRFGFVYGISALDGAPLWMVAPGATDLGSNQAIVSGINDIFYIAINQGGLVTLDPISGTTISSVSVAQSNGPMSIVQVDGASIAVLYQYWYRDEKFLTIVKLDINNLATIWSSQINELPTSNLNVDEDSLYFGTIDGTVYSLSREDGSQQWAFNVNEPVYGLSSDGGSGLLVSAQPAQLIHIRGNSESALCPGVGVPSAGVELGDTPQVIVTSESADVVAAPSKVAVVIETVPQCTVLEIIGSVNERDSDTDFIQVTAPESGRTGWIDISYIDPVVLEGE